jgi:hypothetical protein
LEFQHLTIEMLGWQNSIFKLRVPSPKILAQAGYMHTWLFRTPIVNSPRMLEVSSNIICCLWNSRSSLTLPILCKTMLNEVKAHENTVDVNLGHEYNSLDDMV